MGLIDSVTWSFPVNLRTGVSFMLCAQRSCSGGGRQGEFFLAVSIDVGSYIGTKTHYYLKKIKRTILKKDQILNKKLKNVCYLMTIRPILHSVLQMSPEFKILSLLTES